MLKDQDKAADFATILGAAVHDMKNSLWLLLQNINEVSAELEHTGAGRALADIQYEAQRLNTGLIQLLSLYRNEYDALPVSLEEQFVDELFDDIVEDTHFYAQRHGVSLTTTVEPGLTWFLDRTLVQVLLQDVVINALRYASGRVELSAWVNNGELVIEVRDDGQGYPADVLEQMAAGSPDIRSGRTGLGLYFAQRIAHAHTREQKSGANEKQSTAIGSIDLQNAVSASPTGLPDHGGILRLRLP